MRPFICMLPPPDVEFYVQETGYVVCSDQFYTGTDSSAHKQAIKV